MNRLFTKGDSVGGSPREDPSSSPRSRGGGGSLERRQTGAVVRVCRGVEVAGEEGSGGDAVQTGGSGWEARQSL